MAEKRKSPRARAVTLLSFSEYAAPEVLEVLGLGATQNVSEGGVLVETPTPLPVGAQAQLEFIVDGEIVRAEAEVVRVAVHGERCKLAFRVLGYRDEADRERVQRLVEARKEAEPAGLDRLGVRPLGGEQTAAAGDRAPAEATRAKEASGRSAHERAAKSAKPKTDEPEAKATKAKKAAKKTKTSSRTKKTSGRTRKTSARTKKASGAKKKTGGAKRTSGRAKKTKGSSPQGGEQA